MDAKEFLLNNNNKKLLYNSKTKVLEDTVNSF